MHAGAMVVRDAFRSAALAALTGLSACGGHGAADGRRAPDVDVAVASVSTASSAALPTAAELAVRFKGHVGALAWQTPVREASNESSRLVGYLRAGAVVAADDGPGVRGGGCGGAWRAIAPVGYVCVAPGLATADTQSEALRAYAARPSAETTLPYLYGIVRRPGPIYGRAPSRQEAEATEPGLAERITAWSTAAGDDGASFRPEYWTRNRPAPAALTLWQQGTSDDLPAFLAGSKSLPLALGAPKRDDGLIAGQMKRHNGFSFVDTFVAGGRRYALTPDLLVLPIDRLRPIEGSRYHGIEIPRDARPPFGIVRVEGGTLLQREGKRYVEGAALARRAVVALTGRQDVTAGHMFFEVEGGGWVSDRFVSRVDVAKKMPKWAKDGERWIDVNISKQILIAYEGEVPVFATLVSTGEAGLGDPETSKSTKRGIFRIHTKHVAATMDSDVVGEEFELRDIPYVQYFKDSYALHAAYWHDDFGRPRSHGCINLAPEDAKRLFGWTEPRLPDGWHSVMSPLRGSVVFVHP